MADTDSIDSAPASTPSPRSMSRGRDFQSSGRGGVGNIRRASKDPASPTAPLSPSNPASPGVDPVQDLSIARGREPAVPSERAQTTGRGGVGNINSGNMARMVSHVPSAEAHPQTASLMANHAEMEAEYERSVLKENEEAAKARKQSSGRGGMGNIVRSQSKGPRSKSKTSRSKSKTPRSQSRDRRSLRSPSREPRHSVGRGGVGNLYPGSTEEAEYIDELDNEEMERLRATHAEGIHSTGRGGLANITPLSPHSPDPPLDHAHIHCNEDGTPVSPSHEHHAHIESTGRGGVGNIFRSRSRSASKERSHARLGDIWKRVRSRSRAAKDKDRRSQDVAGVEMDIRGLSISDNVHQGEQGENEASSSSSPSRAEEAWKTDQPVPQTHEE